MSLIKLSLSVCDYDRTRAVIDGRAPIEGCDVTVVPLEPEESFHRALKYQEFDVSQISLSSHIMTTARRRSLHRRARLRLAPVPP